MKRGDYAALALFFVQAAFALYLARFRHPVLPGLGDHYFNIPLLPLSESLSSVRTLGYPLFHAFMARAGWGLDAYPAVQMVLLLPCVFVFWWGLRAYGLSGLAALAAVSPLFWMAPVELVMPETPAKCFAIATIGFVLWAAGTRRIVAYAGLAASIFLAYQMRPAFLFLVVFVPVAWLVLYTRRWGLLDPCQWARNALWTAAASIVPLLLFCFLRLVIVGHFGLVSFGGQNTVGIAVEMLSPEAIDQLPVRDRPLALVLHRARVAWPTPRFLTTQGVPDDWNDAAIQYAANINRIARTMQAKFPSPDAGEDNVGQDKALSHMSTGVFRARPDLYAAWLMAAALEGAKVATELLLGGGGDEGFGLGRPASLGILLVLIALMISSWLLERRAFGEGSRPHYARAVTVVLFLASLFFLLNMLLVILVEPPIARYVQAAAFLLPCVAAALYWDRAVVLAAGLCRQPYWYGQCYANYPAIPDLRRALPWRTWGARLKPSRRGWGIAACILMAVAAAAWWSTRDNRFFSMLARHPEQLRERLLESPDPVTWRDAGGATVLHYAALHGDTPLVEHLIATGLPVGSTTDQDATALHWAALGGGDASMIQALVGAGLSADSPGPLGLSPIHLAALSGKAPALDALLDGGVDPDLPSPGRVAPLHLAASRAVVDALLEHGADINVRDGADATPLHWAHTRELAAYLVEHGADVNAKENWRSFVRGCTPLHKAVYQNDTETAAWLLDHGADPNAGDINNFSPLYYAIWRKNRLLVTVLLDHGADPNHPGRWLAYHREDPGFRFTDIYGKTIGADPNRNAFAGLVPDEATLRPLDWAAFLGNRELIDLLLERGADMALHNGAGMSALHWAVLGSREPAAKRLMRHDPGMAKLDDAKWPVDAFKKTVRAAE